jgi:hypothetical protein
MEAVFDWIFFTSIYGVFIICAILLGVLTLLKKAAPKMPDLTWLVGVLFLVLLFTFPTVKRYQFDSQARKMMKNLPPYSRIIHKSHGASITEPITWFKDFISNVDVVAPNAFPNFGYRRVVMYFDEEPAISDEDPNCDSRKISISEPDSKGVFKVIEFNQEMNSEEFKLYCETDWTKEKEILRLSILGVSSKKNNKKPPVK